MNWRMQVCSHIGRKAKAVLATIIKARWSHPDYTSYLVGLKRQSFYQKISIVCRSARQDLSKELSSASNASTIQVRREMLETFRDILKCQTLSEAEVASLACLFPRGHVLAFKCSFPSLGGSALRGGRGRQASSDSSPSQLMTPRHVLLVPRARYMAGERREPKTFDRTRTTDAEGPE